MNELADPEIVLARTNELISALYNPVFIDGFGFFFKEFPGKPGKSIYVGVCMFGFDKDGKAYHLENKNGKCVLLEVYHQSIKDKQPGVSFTIKKENLVTRECTYYRHKSNFTDALNETGNKVKKLLEHLRK